MDRREVRGCSMSGDMSGEAPGWCSVVGRKTAKILNHTSTVHGLPALRRAPRKPPRTPQSALAKAFPASPPRLSRWPPEAPPLLWLTRRSAFLPRPAAAATTAVAQQQPRRRPRRLLLLLVLGLRGPYGDPSSGTRALGRHIRSRSPRPSRLRGKTRTSLTLRSPRVSTRSSTFLAMVASTTK